MSQRTTVAYGLNEPSGNPVDTPASDSQRMSLAWGVLLFTSEKDSLPVAGALPASRCRNAAMSQRVTVANGLKDPSG